MPPSVSVSLSRGGSLFVECPELDAEAARRSNNSKPPEVWIDGARDLIGPAAEALVVCGSMEEAWLATAVIDALGPFDRLHARKVLNGERAKSWTLTLGRSSPSASVALSLQERLKEAGTRGEPPAFDLYVAVYPRCKRLVRALGHTGGDSGLLRPSPLWAPRLAIEYDGGGHRTADRKDKSRDLLTFLKRRAPTLRVAPESIKRSEEWRQFRPVAAAVRQWVDQTVDAAHAVDQSVAAIVQSYEDELVSIAAFVDHAHEEILAGNVQEGADILAALRSDRNWRGRPFSDIPPARQLVRLADRSTYEAALRVAEGIGRELPPGLSVLPPSWGRTRA